MLARAEWRRRKLTKRLKEEEERIEEDEADTRKRLKTSREHHKKWEETRETRVGTWRDFAKKKGKKARLGASGCWVNFSTCVLPYQTQCIRPGGSADCL